MIITATTTGTVILVLIAAALALDGCGSAAAIHTTTASQRQVQTLDQKARQCGVSTTQSCQAAWNADEKVGAIRCGAGLLTDTSCVFARNVLHAYQTAQRTYGRPPTGMTVTTNPVACDGTSGSWHCRSRLNSAVWVSYRDS